MRRAAALAALALPLVVAPAAAQPERSVEYVIVEIDVGTDAMLSVSETIAFEHKTLVTPAFRTLALRTSDGHFLRVRDVTANTAVGVTEREHAMEIRLRGPLTLDAGGDVVLHLSYKVYRALRRGVDRDSLEWPVLPNEWKATVNGLRVDVRLPSSLPPRGDLQASLKKSTGEPVGVATIKGSQFVRLEAARPVEPGQSVRLTVTWPAGHVDFATPEPAAPMPWPSLAWSGAWIVPGALLLLTGLVWMNGHYAGRRAVVPVYGPPAVLRPGEAGVVIDGRIDPEDIVAAVVDLAARGYLALERRADEDDVVVSVQRPWINDPEIRPWEIALLVSIFTSPGFPSIMLSVLRAPHDSASIREALSIDLAERGLFSSAPIALRRVGRWIAVIVTAIWMQVAWNEGAGLSTVLAGFATGISLWLLAGAVAAGGLTAEGRRARQSLHGFREFLLRVDKHRLERLTPGTLDDHLPWAIALGVTEGWLAPTAPR